MSGKYGNVTKLVMKPGGLSKLKNSVGVRDDLKDRSDRIAAAATSAAPNGAEFEVDTQRVTDNGRKLGSARASVRTGNSTAVRAEARQRILIQALQAGRD